MKKDFVSTILLCSFIPVLALSVFASGSYAQTEAELMRATIHPSVVRLDPSEEQQFKIVFKATRLMAASAAEEVKWAVNDIRGGNKELGTIDAEGLYRAPAKVPVPYEIHICAEAEGAENRYLWATVLMADPSPEYKMVGGWAEPIEGSEYLSEPHGIGLDKDGNLLIADTGNGRVVRFSREGKYLGEIGTGSGSGPGQFTEPRVVEIDRKGRIFVNDRKSDRPRIQVFTPKGKFIRMFAAKGTGPGHILRGHGLGFNDAQQLYVTDVDNMRVNAYEHSGEFLFSFGKDGMEPGEFNAPHGLTMDRNGEIFVQGYYGPCQKFTGDGKYILDFAHGDPPDGPVYFHSIAGDRWGNVYLTVRTKAGYDNALQDSSGNRVSILKYNNNGDYVASLSLSVEAHRESWAVIDNDGLVYALYKGETETGIEVLKQQ